MVDTNVFGEVAGQFTQRIFSGLLWFGIALIIILVLGGVMWYFFIYKRKFDITTKIISERAEDKDSIIFDRAAILVDRKTRTKYFKLWSLGIELPVPPFNILQRTNKRDYLELRRTAEDKIYFLLPPKISKQYIVKADGKIYPISSQEMKMMDPDISYWQVKRKTQNKGMFDPEKMWMKILPYVPFIMAGAITIFILYILMSYLPSILAQLQQLTAELNRGRVAQVTTGAILALI